MDLPPLSSFSFLLSFSIFFSPPSFPLLLPALLSLRPCPLVPTFCFWFLFLTYLHACAREDSLDVEKPTYAIAAAPWMRCVPTSVPGLLAQSL